MSWGRANGLRAMELGRPGASRQRLNDYVLHGEKRATAGLLAVDYHAEDEPVEQVGELLALVDDAGEAVATLRVTDVAVRRFADVSWEFAQAEGEGFTSLEHWRDGHRSFWAHDGFAVEDDTPVVCVHFDLVDADTEDDPEAAKRWVAGVFDRASETYGRSGVELFGVVGRTLVARADLQPGERVLELGCGRGAATWPAAQRVGRSGHVLALDLAEGMVDRTRRDLAEAGMSQVTCRVGDAEDPGVDAGVWDVVLASLVLFFLPRHEQAMRSYRRLLRPGGRLAFSWFADEDSRWEPVFTALVAALPESERGPRRPDEDGPFGGLQAMDAFLSEVGYRAVTEVEDVPVRYPDEATWRSTLWSHGMRGTMEKLRDLGLLEATMARVSSELDAVRTPDGALEWVPRIAYTVALSPA